MRYEIKKLAELNIQVIDGDRGKNYPHKEELYAKGDCLFLSANNVTKDGFRFDELQFITKEKDEILRGGKLQRGDVVITTRGTVGNVGYYDDSVPYDNMRINSGMLIVRCGEGISSQYLYYVFKSDWFVNQMRSIQSGSAQPQLPKSHFLKMYIPYPMFIVQQQIVALLDCIDDKIELNNAINHNLQQQAQAIFRSWFIENEESISWPYGVFADLLTGIVGGDWGKDSPAGNNTEMVYCIRGADIPEVCVGNKGKMPIRYILLKNYLAKRLVEGDIVVEISGGSPTQSTGRVAAISKALLDRYDKGMVCTNFCRALKPLTGYSMYVYHYWQYLYDKGVFFSYENGTTGIKNLDINGFAETEPIIIAPIKEIKKFDELCQNIYSKIYANGLENEKLAILRDTLLPKLMSGELDVSEVEI